MSEREAAPLTMFTVLRLLVSSVLTAAVACSSGVNEADRQARIACTYVATASGEASAGVFRFELGYPVKASRHFTAAAEALGSAQTAADVARADPSELSPEARRVLDRLPHPYRQQHLQRLASRPERLLERGGIKAIINVIHDISYTQGRCDSLL